MSYIAKTCLIAFSCTYAGLALAIDEQSALQQAVSFVKSVKTLDPTAEELNLGRWHIRRSDRLHADHSALWQVGGDGHSLSVDDSTGKVTRYSNSIFYSRVQGPKAVKAARTGKAFYASETDLVSKAKAKLETLHWPFGSEVIHRPLQSPNDQGEINRSIVYLKFCDKPNGYSTNQSGNICVIGLDSLTGDVIELQRRMGYLYGPAQVKVTSTEATAIASQSIDLEKSGKASGPQYVEILGVGELSDRAKELYQSKTIPLVYFIHGTKKDALIAADTGEILVSYDNAVAGEKTQSSTPQSSPALDRSVSGSPVSERDKRDNLALIVLSLLLVTLGGAYLALRFRVDKQKLLRHD